MPWFFSYFGLLPFNRATGAQSKIYSQFTFLLHSCQNQIIRQIQFKVILVTLEWSMQLYLLEDWRCSLKKKRIIILGAENHIINGDTEKCDECFRKRNDIYWTMQEDWSSLLTLWRCISELLYGYILPADSEPFKSFLIMFFSLFLMWKYKLQYQVYEMTCGRKKQLLYLEQPNSRELVCICLKLTQTPGLCVLTKARWQAESFSIFMIVTSEIIETGH